MSPLTSTLVADNNRTKHCVDLPGVVFENGNIWFCGLNFSTVAIHIVTCFIPDKARTQLSREGVEKVLGSFSLTVLGLI